MFKQLTKKQSMEFVKSKLIDRCARDLIKIAEGISSGEIFTELNLENEDDIFIAFPTLNILHRKTFSARKVGLIYQYMTQCAGYPDGKTPSFPSFQMLTRRNMKFLRAYMRGEIDKVSGSRLPEPEKVVPDHATYTNIRYEDVVAASKRPD